MNLSSEELGLVHACIETKLQELRDRIAATESKEDRELVFKLAVLRNKIDAHQTPKVHTCGINEGKQTGYSMADCDACSS